MTLSQENRIISAGRVLVHGGNGVQGSAIATQLRDEGFDVVACVRDPHKAATLTARDIPIATADLNRPDTLLKANRDVDAVVLTVPLEGTREVVLRWVKNASEAARACGVSRMVLNTSARTPRERTNMANIELRRDIEALVHIYGPPTTVLRPPLFMENLEAPWIVGAVARDRVVAYPVAAAVRVAWLSVRDLGAYVGAALRRPDLAGQAVDIGGPEALDGDELAQQFSRAVGQPVQYAALPPAVVEQQLGLLLGEAVAKEIARTYAWIAEHPNMELFIGTSQELARDLRRAPLAVYDWACMRERAALFRGDSL